MEAQLRELVELGLEQLRRGEAIDLDEASLPKFFDELKTRGRKRLARKTGEGGKRA